ncbi:MAG: ABC transporter substrate-binding protein [Caldisericota bacterium]|nr:ABC transporter substrate-binding protein [Caldisericota bacterium]
MEPSAFCTECGKPLPPEAKHCPNCGADAPAHDAAPVDEARQVPAPPPQQPYVQPAATAPYVAAPAPPQPVQSAPYSGPGAVPAAPYGGPGATPGASYGGPGGAPASPYAVPAPPPGHQYARASASAKRLGGGFIAVLGGIAMLAVQIYYIVTSETPLGELSWQALLNPGLGLLCLVSGIVTLSVRGWGPVLLAALLSGGVFAACGYKLYQTMTWLQTQTAADATMWTVQNGGIVWVGGMMLGMIAFGKVFQSLFSRSSSRIRTTSPYIVLLIAIALAATTGCAPAVRTVVCYTSVDQQYADPVLAAFEAETGIRVLSVFDTEAAKTTGLVNRVVAEKANPACDVFWNNEMTQMSVLIQNDVLEPLPDDAGVGVLAQYRDPNGLWVGHAARFRVILTNTNILTGTAPASVLDLVSPAYARGSVGMAMPLFGTTASHAAALYAVLGEARARSYYEQVSAAGVRIVDGNGTVRDLVGQGVLAWGMTDSDDALGAVKRGDPVAVVVPDQDGMGTLVIPSCVALVRGAPHGTEAAILARYLLSEKVEGMLMESGYCQLSTRTEGGIAALTGTSIKGMDVDPATIAAAMPTAKADLTAIFGQ